MWSHRQSQTAIQQARAKALAQQRFTGAGRTDQQNIDLDNSTSSDAARC
jgi:hypothetical protein